MKNKLYYDPQEDESIGGAIINAMSDDSNESEKPESKEEVKSEENPKTKFAWGDEDRRKERAKLTDEDELELGYENEDKTPAKAKLSEIKNAAKFLKENNDTIRAALGMKKELAANPDLAKAFTTFWERSFEGNKFNKEFVGKMSSFLDGKSDVIKEQIQEGTDDIKEMEAALSELDPESPQARALKISINGLKSTRAQLKEALATIKTLQEKTEGHDKFKTSFEETQKKQKDDADAQEASKIFDRELNALTSKDSKTGYHFEDKEDSGEFEELVRDIVASQAAKGLINNDDDFVKSIREAAKQSFEKISRRNEKTINAYLKKKGQLPPKDNEENKEIKNEEVEEESIGEFFSSKFFPKA